MPELPEVETIKIGLSSLILSKKIEAIKFDNPKSFPNDPDIYNAHLIGRQIIEVRRRGKVLLIDLDNGYTLMVHLKMTGQLVYVSEYTRFGAGHPTESLISHLPDKSTRVVISLSYNSRLYFNDQRKFGWMKLYPTEKIGELPFFSNLGPEPLDKDFNWVELKKRVSKRSRSSIKPVLLDQSIIAGIGNIYADESLWGAKIHPESKVGSLTDQDFERLFVAIQTVLRLSISKGGSTDRNYVDAEGRKGSYLNFAQVFRRENQPCPECGTLIIKIRLYGRGTHLCPSCQVVIPNKSHIHPI